MRRRVIIYTDLYRELSEYLVFSVLREKLSM